MAGNHPNRKNHFNRLKKLARPIEIWLRLIRRRIPQFFKFLQIIGFVLITIAAWLIEHVCEGGGTVMLFLAILSVLLFVIIFAFDYIVAKRINHQFFWKPWLMIFLLVFVIMFLGLRIGGQRKENARQLQETNDFYADITRNLSNRIDLINSDYTTKAGQLHDTISGLNSQLTDAKQERDKYQLMLAPFQAAALKIFTNAPLDQRLDLLADEMGIITNALGVMGGFAKQAILELRANGQTNLSYSYADLGQVNEVTNHITMSNVWQIQISILNRSKFPALHGFVDLFAVSDPTNVVATGWQPEPFAYGRAYWRYDANLSIPKNGEWYVATIIISTNLSQSVLHTQIDFSADNAETKSCFIEFLFKAPP